MFLSKEQAQTLLAHADCIAVLRDALGKAIADYDTQATQWARESLFTPDQVRPALVAHGRCLALRELAEELSKLVGG